MKRYAGLLWLIRLYQRRFRVLSGLEHLPRTGPYILAGNHVGSPDPLYVASVVYFYTRRSVVFLAYDKIAKKFGHDIAYQWLGAVDKKEGNLAASLLPLRQELEAGNAVGIFPEGMRNAAPFVLPGKTGVARLAHWTGVPVIPFGFDGPFTWSVTEGVRAALSWKRNLRLHFGAPLHFPKIPEDQLTKEKLTETTRTIMQRVGELAGRPSPF
ncbi:MAG: lysophospholipid acyltransferase family protein [Patescibacteria group bacterium]